MADPILVDANTFLYALGDEHPKRSAAQEVVRRAARGELQLHASVEAIQEVVHHRLRRVDRGQAVTAGRRCAHLCTMHPFDVVVMERALQLIEQIPTLRGRDAVHAATAAVHGLDTIISTDPDFDGIPGLRRIDPADLVADPRS